MVDLYYRYSFYLDGTYNVHKGGVSILLDLIPGDIRIIKGIFGTIGPIGIVHQMPVYSNDRMVLGIGVITIKEAPYRRADWKS